MWYIPLVEWNGNGMSSTLHCGIQCPAWTNETHLAMSFRYSAHAEYCRNTTSSIYFKRCIFTHQKYKRTFHTSKVFLLRILDAKVLLKKKSAYFCLSVYFCLTLACGGAVHRLSSLRRSVFWFVVSCCSLSQWQIVFSDIVICTLGEDYSHNFTVASQSKQRLETDVEIAHSDGFCWIDSLDSTLLPVLNCQSRLVFP